MNNPSPKRARRMALLISGAIDAVLGAILLLIGFGLLPVDLGTFGVESWHVNLLGAVLFLLGAGTFAYNVARLHEE